LPGEELGAPTGVVVVLPSAAVLVVVVSAQAGGEPVSAEPVAGASAAINVTRLKPRVSIPK
jgi:hypothetical protein